MAWSTRSPRVRQEASVLVASALFLLVLLSTFTLLAYRSAVIVLVDERQAEAEELARWITRSQLPGPARLPRSGELQRMAPNARAVRIVDADGGVRVGVPASDAAGVVVGRASFVRGDETYRVEVDLPAALLLSRERALRILTPIVLGVDVAVLLLVMLYVRRLMAPFSRLIDRARELGEEPRDEMAFFVETFERAIEQLSRQDEDLQALEDLLGESLASGVLVCDAEGVVVALNPIGSDMLGLDRAQALGHPLLDLLDQTEHADLAARFSDLLRDGTTLSREEVTLGGADNRVLGLTAQPLRRDDGRIRGFLVLFADLTEVQRRLADERLSEGLKQLGELTAGVAHEMRNGLATLKGYLTLVERTDKATAIRDYVSEIRLETEHLQRVAEDFLAFARPGRGRLDALDLVQVVHRVIADPAVDADVRPRFRIEPPAVIRGDDALLGRALSNLVQNAADAQSGRAEIELDLNAADGGYQVDILDRGPGLPPALRDRLFDPFVSGRAGGVGLGLALTRRIVLLHGGRVSLDDRPGGGVVASVWLPDGKTVTDGSDP